jgi:hypothetical protein
MGGAESGAVVAFRAARKPEHYRCFHRSRCWVTIDCGENGDAKINSDRRSFASIIALLQHRRSRATKSHKDADNNAVISARMWRSNVRRIHRTSSVVWFISRKENATITHLEKFFDLGENFCQELPLGAR